MFVGDEPRIVLAGDEARDGFHRAGAIEGNDSRDIFDVMWLKAQAHAGHTGRFHLEYAGGAATRQHIKGGLVIRRDGVEGKVRLAALYHLHRIIENRQVTKTQEVHFQKTQFLQRHHRILANDRFIVTSQRNILVDRALGDHYAGSMSGCMARHTFHCARHIDQTAYFIVGLVEIGELLAQPQCIVQRDMKRSRHQFGHDVHFGIGDIQNTTYVTDGAAGGHSAEGNDLRYMIFAVLAAYIVHYFAAAGITEVHIDIGHGNTLRVQKTLKIEAVLHGVDIGDMQTVRNHAACGAATAGADRDADALGVAHKVGNDQEIIGKSHFFDHIHFVFQLLPVTLFFGTVAFAETLFTKFSKIGWRIIARGQFKLRQMILAESKLQLASIRDALRVFHCVGIAAEQFRHLFRGAQIEVLRLIAHTVGIIHRFAGLDAQQHIVALSILFAQIVGIIGGYQRNTGLLMEAQHGAVDFLLFGDTVILQFQIEVSLAKNLLHHQGILFGTFKIAVHQPLGNFAGKTSRKADQTFGMSAQKL